MGYERRDDNSVCKYQLEDLGRSLASAGDTAYVLDAGFCLALACFCLYQRVLPSCKEAQDVQPCFMLEQSPKSHEPSTRYHIPCRSSNRQGDARRMDQDCFKNVFLASSKASTFRAGLACEQNVPDNQGQYHSIQSSKSTSFVISSHSSGSSSTKSQSADSFL